MSIITKVKAHQDVSRLTDLQDIWGATMNNYVDGVPKKRVKNSVWGTIRAREAFCKKRMFDISMLRSLLQCWGEMNARVMKKIQTLKPARAGTMPEFKLMIGPGVLSPVSCHITDHVLSTCPYGPVFARRVRDYLIRLEWDMQRNNQQSVCLNCTLTFH